MTEYRVKVQGTNTDAHLRKDVAVRNIAELNANLARIESIVAYEIQRNLPHTIAVSSVGVQFMVDARAVEGDVTYAGDPKDIVDLHIFLVNLPRLVFERLPKILSESGIVRLDYIPTFDVSSAPVDPLPAPSRSGSPQPVPPIPPAPAAPAASGPDRWNRSMQLVLIALACCAVVLVVVAIVMIIHLGFVGRGSNPCECGVTPTPTSVLLYLRYVL